MPFEYAWRLVRTDCSAIELELHLDGQKTWKKKSSQHEPCTVCTVRFEAHTMQYAIYQCNSSACTELAGALSCDWYLRSKMCDLAKRGSIEQHGQHTSTLHDPPRIKLNLSMKRFVHEQTMLKLKPSRILNAMIDKGLLSENAYRFLGSVQRCSYQFRTKVMHDNNNVDEMEALLASRPYHVSLGDSVAFAFGFSTDLNGTPSLALGSEERPVVIGFSSKRLLRNLTHAGDHVLHIDATFKLNTARFPAIVLGVSDVRRQFHPVAFFITSDLRHTQIEEVVRSTLRQYQVVTGSAASVRYVMSDADVAQRNAIELVVAQELGIGCRPVFLMCFFHVMQNVKKHIASVPVSARPLILKHVYRLHYARTQTDLDRRIASAVHVWKQHPGCRGFERYFSQQWLTGRFTQWQCLSTPPGFAKTNNPLEQFNKEIKRDYSLRSLVSVNSLAQSFLDMCHHRSARSKTFETTPHASFDQVRRYKILLAGNRLAVTSAYRSSIIFMNGGEQRRVFRVFQSGVDMPKKNKKISELLKDELVRAENAMEVESQPSNGWNVDVDAGACDCSNWFKFGYCVHLIVCRVNLDKPVEGMLTKRTFVNKGKQGTKRGQVGHALAIE
jgi:hypothetical protein